MFKGLILPAFAIVGLLSAMSAISSDEVTKPSDLNATMHVEKLVLGSGCFGGQKNAMKHLMGYSMQSRAMPMGMGLNQLTET